MSAFGNQGMTAKTQLLAFLSINWAGGKVLEIVQIADAWLLKNLDQVRVGFELGSTEAIKRVVAVSDALGCLSRYAVAQSVEDGHLVKLRTRLPKATQLTDGWSHAFAELDVELDGSSSVFVRIHELPPGSPIFFPHPLLRPEQQSQLCGLSAGAAA